MLKFLFHDNYKIYLKQRHNVYRARACSHTVCLCHFCWFSSFVHYDFFVSGLSKHSINRLFECVCVWQYISALAVISTPKKQQHMHKHEIRSQSVNSSTFTWHDRWIQIKIDVRAQTYLLKFDYTIKPLSLFNRNSNHLRTALESVAVSHQIFTLH